MTDLKNKLIHDLSKKYVFENFDFKNKSPEDLLMFYQETSEKIANAIEIRNTRVAKQNSSFSVELID